MRRAQSRDAGPATVAVWVLVTVGLLASQVASAATLSSVRISEQGRTEVVVVLEADAPPTFQVFGEGLHYTIELPGSDLKKSALKRARSILLEDARLDTKSKRVQLRFFGTVDYDARVNGRRLVVTFTHLGERATLERLAGLRAEVARLQKRPGAPAPLPVKEPATGKRELARLEAQKRKLAGEVQAAAKQRANLERAAADAKRAAAVAERSLKQDRDKRRELSGKLAQLEQKKAAARTELVALERERDRALDEQRKAEGRTRDETQKRAALVRETERLKTELAAEARKIKIKESLAVLQERAKKTQAALDQLTKSSAQKSREVEDLKRQSMTLTGEVATLAQTRQGLSRRVEADRAVANDATKAAAAARAAFQRAEKQAQSARMNRDALKREVSALQARKDEITGRIATLTKGERDAGASLASLQREERKVQGSLKTLRTELADLKSRASRERARLARAPARPPPAREPARPKPIKPERIEIASLHTSTKQGFGGRSVDLRRASNRYERTTRYDDDDEIGRGALSRITVQRRGDASRVGIRVDGGAQYSVRRANDRSVILTLFDTRAANLDVRRIVDARNLGTSVLRVLPHVEEGDRARVELTIELRDAADSIRVGHDDSMLWLLVG